MDYGKQKNCEITFPGSHMICVFGILPDLINLIKQDYSASRIDIDLPNDEQNNVSMW
jgi:hypothetical protein